MGGVGLTCQITIPSPSSNVKLLEKADNSTPAPSPSRAPRLICLTAAGLRVFPSFVSGVFASLLCEYGEVLNSEDCWD